MMILMAQGWFLDEMNDDLFRKCASFASMLKMAAGAAAAAAATTVVMHHIIIIIIITALLQYVDVIRGHKVW